MHLALTVTFLPLACKLQLWWWCVAAAGVRVGAPWTALGQAFNCACMVHVTRLTEARMLARGDRAAAYTEYRRRTSCWAPLAPLQKRDGAGAKSD